MADPICCRPTIAKLPNLTPYFYFANFSQTQFLQQLTTPYVYILALRSLSFSLKKSARAGPTIPD